MVNVLHSWKRKRNVHFEIFLPFVSLLHLKSLDLFIYYIYYFSIWVFTFMTSSNQHYWDLVSWWWAGVICGVNSLFSLYRKNLERWKIPTFTYLIYYTFCGIVIKNFFAYSYNSFQVKTGLSSWIINCKQKTWCHNFLFISLEYFLTCVHYLNLLTKSGMNKHVTFYLHETFHTVTVVLLVKKPLQAWWKCFFKRNMTSTLNILIVCN